MKDRRYSSLYHLVSSSSLYTSMVIRIRTIRIVKMMMGEVNGNQLLDFNDNKNKNYEKWTRKK